MRHASGSLRHDGKEKFWKLARYRGMHDFRIKCDYYKPTEVEYFSNHKMDLHLEIKGKGYVGA